MRKITKIYIHCSASNNPDHDDISVIDRWHRKKGWNGCGYHAFIKKDGEVQIGRAVEDEGAHTYGHNQDSLGICLHGLNAEDFTEEQFEACASKCDDWIDEFNITSIEPHNAVSIKSCPVFNVPKEIFRRLGR